MHVVIFYAVPFLGEKAIYRTGLYLFQGTSSRLGADPSYCTVSKGQKAVQYRECRRYLRTCQRHSQHICHHFRTLPGVSATSVGKCRRHLPRRPRHVRVFSATVRIVLSTSIADKRCRRHFRNCRYSTAPVPGEDLRDGPGSAPTASPGCARILGMLPPPPPLLAIPLFQKQFSAHQRRQGVSQGTVRCADVPRTWQGRPLVPGRQGIDPSTTAITARSSGSSGSLDSCGSFWGS